MREEKKRRDNTSVLVCADAYENQGELLYVFVLFLFLFFVLFYIFQVSKQRSTVAAFGASEVLTCL